MEFPVEVNRLDCILFFLSVSVLGNGFFNTGFSFVVLKYMTNTYNNYMYLLQTTLASVIKMLYVICVVEKSRPVNYMDFLLPT